MGNSVTHSPREGRKGKKNSKVEFYNKLKTSHVGDELLTCSFGAWCREQRQVCGFSDKADYTSSRHSLLQLNGSPNRPDTTEGRFFRSGFKTQNELMIQEKETSCCITIKVPRVTSTELSAYLRHNRPRRKRRSHRCTRVVAYHKGYIIVQVNTERFIPFSKFYVIDMDQQVCSGHFVIANNVRRWYEVHMSPSTSHIVLRPDVRYHFQAIINYEVQNIKCYPPMSDITISKIPTYLPNCSITYNALLGDEHVIAAGQRIIQVYKTDDWSVVSVHNLMIPHAHIHQIRSSPSGDFLAVRYTYPADGCHFNRILILHYPSFTKAMRVEVRGAYWPVSEFVNLQVFPRFSLSESCLAVMKQRNCGRKVFVYKLPTELRSLQDLCRRAVLHLVSCKDVNKLPVPELVQRYICQNAN
ncbi:uncharacterized protein LOC101857239 [Aplysia californica]|uniref:Uncharacterized protein LOC101857239 n=1 Tax=Aplysia californica TaxID=6500 RepID=A0ABM0JIK6_APLCA|nr:uncharacterized protein LOC101857239 [Aplysia californica]XP_005094465.1 uncharacterized protein LOC101857239 [Aplysia californica]